MPYSVLDPYGRGKGSSIFPRRNHSNSIRSSQDLSLPVLKRQYESVTKQLHDYRRKYEILQGKFDTLDMESELNNLRSIISHQKEQIKVLNEDNDRMSVIIRQQEKEIAEKSKNTSISSYSSLEQEIKQLELKSSRLQVFLQRKQMTEKSLVSQIKELTLQNSELIQQTSLENQQIDTIMRDSYSNGKGNSNDQMRIENEMLKESLNEFRAIVSSLQASQYRQPKEVIIYKYTNLSDMLYI
jgi:chromosome segregation ATPase